MREILLIENDVRILDLLTRFFVRRGYEVRRAPSLDAAERELSLHRPSMIVSDLLVGDHNSAPRLAQWARAGTLPPTLVVSGCLDEAVKRELAAIPGVLGALPKPFRFEELEARVARVLDAAGAPERSATG